MISDLKGSGSRVKGTAFGYILMIFRLYIVGKLFRKLQSVKYEDPNARTVAQIMFVYLRAYHQKHKLLSGNKRKRSEVDVAMESDDESEAEISADESVLSQRSTHRSEEHLAGLPSPYLPPPPEEDVEEESREAKRRRLEDWVNEYEDIKIEAENDLETTKRELENYKNSSPTHPRLRSIQRRYNKDKDLAKKALNDFSIAMQVLGSELA